MDDGVFQAVKQGFQLVVKGHCDQRDGRKSEDMGTPTTETQGEQKNASSITEM